MTFQADISLLDTMIDDIFDPVKISSFDDGMTSKESKAASWAAFEKFRDNAVERIENQHGPDYKIYEGGEVKTVTSAVGELSALIKESIYGNGNNADVKGAFALRARSIVQSLRDQT